MPEEADAWNKTVRVVGPETFACTCCGPAAAPSVQIAEAVPSVPVCTLPGATWPPPASMVNATAALCTGRPVASVTFTTSGCASAAPAEPDCVSPLRMAIAAGLPSSGNVTSPPQADAAVAR